MSIEEIEKYLDEKLLKKGYIFYGKYHVLLKNRRLVEKSTCDKLESLYTKIWHISSSNHVITGKDINAGILYFNLLHKIVKKLEYEGKL